MDRALNSPALHSRMGQYCGNSSYKNRHLPSQVEPKGYSAINRFRMT